MRASRLLTLVVLALYVGSATAKKGKKDEAHERHMDEMTQRRKELMRETEHLSKIKDHEVSDWSLHTDVDDSVYWFSRSLKRSVKEAPKGWTKDKQGKWQGPPRSKQEL